METILLVVAVFIGISVVMLLTCLWLMSMGWVLYKITDWLGWID
jgi:hypothetical protein